MPKQDDYPIHTRLTAEAAATRLADLHEDWSMNADATSIERTITCRGFAKATYLANLAAYLADRQGHHPDIAFGVGYCRIAYTTHDVDGLSENDFVSAAAFDRLLA